MSQGDAVRCCCHRPSTFRTEELRFRVRRHAQTNVPVRRKNAPWHGNGKSFRIKPVPKQLQQKANNDNLQQSVVFSTKHIQQRELQCWWSVIFPAWDEGWRFLNPLGELFPELRPQERLFCQHDPFVVQPKRQVYINGNHHVRVKQARPRPTRKLARYRGCLTVE